MKRCTIGGAATLAGSTSESADATNSLLIGDGTLARWYDTGVRAFLAGVGAATLAGGPAVCAPAPAAGDAAAPECARSLNGIDLQTASIPQLEAAMAAGRITSVELVDAYLVRIHAYDGQLDSIRVLNPRAREEAAQRDTERAAGRVRGPLQGIPVLLKDNYGTSDM